MARAPVGVLVALVEGVNAGAVVARPPGCAAVLHHGEDGGTVAVVAARFRAGSVGGAEDGEEKGSEGGHDIPNSARGFFAMYARALLM